MSHVTQMNESCHTDEWVMSHIWIPCGHTKVVGNRQIKTVHELFNQWFAHISRIFIFPKKKKSKKKEVISGNRQIKAVHTLFNQWFAHLFRIFILCKEKRKTKRTYQGIARLRLSMSSLMNGSRTFRILYLMHRKLITYMYFSPPIDQKKRSNM